MKRWYIIAYDVRHPKRLRKLHYYLSKKTIAAQKSVYLLRVEKTELHQINKQIRKIANDHHDDVRVFPVLPPQAMWVAGQQQESLDGLFAGESPVTRKAPRKRQFFLFNGG